MSVRGLSVEALRREFDEQFAHPRAEREESEDFLIVGAGGRTWAIGVRSIAGIARDVEIGPLPSHAPAVLGLAVVDRALCAVFDLGAVLGGKPVAALERAWLVRVRAAPDIALAFEALEGRLRGRLERSEPAEGAVRALVAGRVLAEPPHAWVDVDAVVAHLQLESRGPSRGEQR